MQKENCLKQTEINTINQKLNTIQHIYENRLKDVTKLQDDIKRINKEKQGQQKRLNEETDYNKNKIKTIEKDKVELEKQYSNLKSINLKLETKIGHQDKERTIETYGRQEITQPSKYYACGLQEHQIKDCNTDRNIFVKYSRDDTMNVHELKNIMAEYGKIKSLKVIHHQNGGTENRAMIYYETEMETQRAITEINRYKGWRAEKYIANKATRTIQGDQFKERTNTSSRETKTEEKKNDSEKTNQSGIKKETKDCESKLNIFTTLKKT